MCLQMDLPTVSNRCRAMPRHSIIYRVYAVMEECLPSITLQPYYEGHCPVEDCEHITPWPRVLVGIQCSHCQRSHAHGNQPYTPRLVEEIVITGHLRDAPIGIYTQRDQMYTAMEMLCRVPLRVLHFIAPYTDADGPAEPPADPNDEDDDKYEVEIDEQANQLLNVQLSDLEQGDPVDESEG